MYLDAVVGDEIVVDGMKPGEPPRKGEILAVIGEGEHRRFRVRWDNGHESLFFAGSTTHIVHTKQSPHR